MIYTYSTILLASLIVAFIALFLYRVISRSQRSVLGSRETRRETKTKRVLPGQHGYATQRKLALANPATTAMNRKQDNVWPYREKRVLDVGTSHRVKRRLSSERPAQEYAQKPWGW